MVADDRRIRIITGHYGSGKTEFAVNYVKKLRESVDGRVAIADLDIVNVYFRSREKKEELEEKGIQFKVEFEYGFSSPGYDNDFLAIAWIEADGTLELTTVLLEIK